MKTSLWIKWLRCREVVAILFFFLFLLFAALIVAEYLCEVYPYECLAVLIIGLLTVWLMRPRKN